MTGHRTTDHPRKPRRIRIAVPGTADTLTGNWRTAERWAAQFRELGHEV